MALTQEQQSQIAQLVGTGAWTAMRDVLDGIIDRYEKILLGEDTDVTDLKDLNEVCHTKKDMIIFLRKDLKEFRDTPEKYLSIITNQKNMAEHFKSQI